MGEKDEKKNEGEKKADGGGKKDDGPITVVLKLDLHCEGCAKKVKRSVSHFEGVEKVKADCAANKITVVGKVDPAGLRERVEYKTKKKVELLSPQPKKDGGDGGPAAGGDKKTDGKPPEKKAEEKKVDDKKPKEAAVSTEVMKIKLHCDGCAHKIKRLIKKNIYGVDSVSTNLEKDLVTVNGTMNVKELVSIVKEKLNRAVEIVPVKKDDSGGGDKKAASEDKKGKEPAAGSDDKKEKEKEGGGAEKKEIGGGGDEKAKSVGGGGTKVEVNKMEFQGYNPHTYYAAMPMYNSSFTNQDYGLPMYQNVPGYPSTGYVVQYMNGPPPPPPTYLNMNDQMFSDENPNGCFIM
ncbi:heavy metal-associated isoprenylated plant protein 3-like [Primulina eburnea]|uniref:heavy metal-associated isoprenylated plant protein 3-like n=1 Tax=Primulina eburnea TaxID=1245227 RepID=UPI003C6C9786